MWPGRPTKATYTSPASIARKKKLLELRYRLSTDAPIVTKPAYLLPDPKVTGDSGLIFAVSNNGYVYAIVEKTGDTLWQFSTGEPIVERPAVIENHLYVPTELGGMYCLDVKAGQKPLWWAPNVIQFVAASQTRVYATDKLGRILVLSAQTGALLDVLAMQGIPLKMFNVDTDRIFLADHMGLIQCLHEVEQTEPLVHEKDRKLAVAEAEKATKKTRGAATGPAAPEKEPAAPKEPKAKKGEVKPAEAAETPG